MQKEDEEAILVFLKLPPGLAEVEKLTEPYEEYLGQKVINTLLGSHKWEDGYRMGKNGMETWGKGADTGSNSRKVVSNEAEGYFQIKAKLGDLRFDLTVSEDGDQLDLVIEGPRESYFRFNPKAMAEIMTKRYRGREENAALAAEFAKRFSEEGVLVEEMVSCRRTKDGGISTTQSWSYNTVGNEEMPRWMTMTSPDGFVDVIEDKS